MIRGYKVRIYPTKEQTELLWKHIHACRFIWNYMLETINERQKNNQKYLRRFEMIRLLTPLKKQEEYAWLNEVSNHSLQRTCTDLNEAFIAFFNKVRNHPKFKTRKFPKQSYPIRSDVFQINKGFAKIEKLKYVKIKNITIPDGKISDPRISYVNHKWILSFGIECESQACQLTEDVMGIDLGIKKLAVVSFGDKKFEFPNINKSKRMRTLEKKLKYITKVYCRKYQTNGNWEKSKSILKYEAIAREINYKMRYIRHNYIHQITSSLVSLLPSKVVMEKLNIKGMMKNRHLSKAIREQCFYEFIRQMEYKCEDKGIEFVQADRWYPSSKKCSCCGRIKKDLKLSDRIYKCECGLEIDRDYNAAINLKEYVG